jgi:uncharacterized membrane protein
MMTKTTVDAYLHELDDELRDLPAARRRELVEEIREHIESALGEAGTDDDVEVRNVLERLGDPADIAAEARERFGIHRPKPGVREVLALILLPIGGALYLVGWVAGAILLATSNVWTSREKVIGLLVVPGGLLPAILFGLMSGGECPVMESADGVVSETCSGGMPIWLGWVILIILVIAPIWTVFFLATRMNRRAATP